MRFNFKLYLLSNLKFLGGVVMSEFVFNDCTYGDSGWLKPKDLVEGHVYIIKDGRIVIYLGKTASNLYCFYICCHAYFKSSNRMLSFANYEIQLNGIINVCNASVNHQMYCESLQTLKGLPKIYCEFPFVNYESSYKNWYMKSQLSLGNLPVISSGSNVKPSSGFVSTKDLIPGTLYYSGECWRSTFAYLGRTSDKRFIWYFIGNEDILLRSSAYQLIQKADTTKSNKRVKPLAEALKDHNAYVSGACKKLINMGYKIDMSGVTQEMLDMAR